MSPASSVAKSDLRRRLREQRRALAPDARRHAAQELAVHLTETAMYRASRRVACYLSNDGEIDTDDVIARLRRDGKQLFLPVLSRLRHDRLWFAPAPPGVELVDNRYGIPEPKMPARALLRAQHLDLVLLPLVGFDAAGHRLGMGGGYYDRSLAFLTRRRHWHRPRLIGLAYDIQKVATLPHAEWDVGLNAVVTEAGVYLPEGTD